MPPRVDVGSILGGRYKVTGQITTSADEDLVLDGVDQVLNRSVSILVAGPDHAEQVAASAREIATGERPGNVQVLDLGLTDGSTYLVTNHTSAADLLDLVVAANPPYVEPFFTDTLGTEIFGQPRSTEPESYDERYEHVQYDDEPRYEAPQTKPGRQAVPPPPSVPPKSGARRADDHDGGSQGAAGAGAGAAGAAGAGAAGAGAADTGAASKPKVTLWDDNDYGYVDEEPGQKPRERGGAGAGAATGAGAAAGAGSARAASHFPAAARGNNENFAEYDDSEDRKKSPGFTRWLVGGILAVLLIAAVVLAVGQLGSMFQPVASDPTETSQEASSTPAESESEEESGEESGSASPEESQSPSPTEDSADTVEPVATSVTRLVPDSPDLDSVNDGELPLTIDDNPATAWNSLLYADNTFGGFASNLALVIGLEEQSTVTQVELEQLNGSGGSFEILLNDDPTLEGAQQVAQGSFTAPSITLPIPEQDGEPRTAEYVIINFTGLPELSNSSGPYPWGIKLAEVNIS